MSLRDILFTKMNKPYLDATLNGTTSDNAALRADWKQFVLDHLPWLKARAMVYDVTESVMPAVRYNIQRYMLDKGIETQLWWIVLALNNFKSDMDFDKNLYPREGEDTNNTYMRLYLPAREDIATLHELWSTTSQISSSSTIIDNI